MIMALAAFTTSTAFAQTNKNKTEETVTTKTAVKSELGTDVSTKNVTTSKKQAIGLADEDANKTNQTIVMQPSKINTSVDYGYEGNRFKFINQEDKDGYRMMTVKDNATQEEYAIIKPSSQNGYYIMSQNGKSSFGYFNADGNFVVERYDAKLDAVVSDVYKLDMKQDSMKKNKM